VRLAGSGESVVDVLPKLSARVRVGMFTKFNAIVYSTANATKRPRVPETHVMTSIARKFEQFVEAYRRPDGGKWGGQDLEDATGGVVTRSYITHLRKGRIKSPGYEKLAGIAKAMGFPPKLWFEDSDATVHVEATDQNLSFSDRVNLLFESIRDEKTGQTYTNAEVARMSLGDITEDEVEGIRSGSILNPSFSKVLALASAFSIYPSYFVERGKKLPLIDQEVLEISRDETVSAIAHKSLHLPDRERQMILNIIQQFEDMHNTEDEDRAT
jgi:transcriptional regulator with XRE-family HTH domain